MAADSLAGEHRLHVGIVGAGLAGLAAARALVALGHDVVVLDKGRGPGGRISSRRAEPFAFDHGAQYFTARDPVFRSALDGWLEAGVVARWDGRIVALRAGGAHPVREVTERFVGTPRMSALARHLARGVEVRCGVRVVALRHEDRRWRLAGPDGVELGRFDRVVVTTPPPQAAALIGASSPLGARAARVVMRPCWAVLLGLAAPYPVDLDGAFCEDAALAWVARDSSKPARPRAEAWVLHATPEWTEARLDAEREEVAELLAAELVRLTGVPLPAVVHRDAHLWRFARPDDGHGIEVPVDRERGLVLAGDAYRGGRVEGAYLSGEAAARAL